MSLLEGVRFPGAACAGVDPDLFFPERGESVDAAKAVCAECPHRVECLEWALEAGEVDGVWGGESARTRRRMRTERTAALRPVVLGVLGEGPATSTAVARVVGAPVWGVMRALGAAGLVVQVGTEYDGSRMVPVWAVAS